MTYGYIGVVHWAELIRLIYPDWATRLGLMSGLAISSARVLNKQKSVKTWAVVYPTTFGPPVKEYRSRTFGLGDTVFYIISDCCIKLNG